MQQVLLLFFILEKIKGWGKLSSSICWRKRTREQDARFLFVWLPTSSLSCLISRAAQLLTHRIREGGGGVEGGLLPLRASVGLKIKDGGGRASLLDLPRDFSEIENLLAG